MTITQTAGELYPELAQYQRRLILGGALGLALSLVEFLFKPTQFYQSYLMAYMFCLGITLGALALGMVHQLSGGAWGIVIRRPIGAATRLLPLMTALFLPVVIGMNNLYPWTHPSTVAGDELLQLKRAYLNVPFFLLRAAIYFAAWNAISYWLNKWAVEQDRTAEPRFTRRMKMLSGPGLGLFVLTTTFASIDWVMSLDPEWSSTMFGLLFVASWALSAMAFVIATMSLLSSRTPMADIVRASHFHDLGKLLLALVMLWSYFAFSQFLIIWSGNLPEETTWYLRRLRGGWGWIAIAVIVLHFALPFLLLLSRDLKRNARKLAMLAGFLLVMRLVDLFWMIEPEFNRAHFHLSWMDVASPLGIGGIWLAMFSWQLQQRPLVPLNDPQLESVLEEARKPVGAEAESY